MNRCPLVLVGLAAFAVTAGCAKTVNVEQERTALMSVDREWSQTASDPDKFASYFAEDGSTYSPGMPIITGRDAIRKTFTGMTKMPGFALSWTVTKADVSAS